MNLLAIDQGNSRTKFWLKTAAGEKKWSCASGEESNCKELKSLPADLSVAIASVNPHHCEGLISLFKTAKLYNLSSAYPLPIKINYKDSARLGIDRVMGAVGAARLCGVPVITVLAGTATVVDLVDAEGVYHGGFIAPGISSAADGLYNAAPALPHVELSADIKIPGTTPEECVLAGIVASAIGGIKEMVSQLAAFGGGKDNIVVSGGWGKLVAEYIENHENKVGTIKYIEDLVLLGVMHSLECICNDAESV